MTRIDFLKETLNDFSILRDRANSRILNLNLDLIAYEGAAYYFKLTDRERLEVDVNYLNKCLNEIILEISEIEC